MNCGSMNFYNLSTNKWINKEKTIPKTILNTKFKSSTKTNKWKRNLPKSARLWKKWEVKHYLVARMTLTSIGLDTFSHNFDFKSQRLIFLLEFQCGWNNSNFYSLRLLYFDFISRFCRTHIGDFPSRRKTLSSYICHHKRRRIVMKGFSIFWARQSKMILDYRTVIKWT